MEALEREIGRADWMRSFVEAGIEQFAALYDIRRATSARLVCWRQIGRSSRHPQANRVDIWETSVRAK
jgi:hypothetical protein